MKVMVDLNRCQAYAQCCYAAPESFRLEGQEILIFEPWPRPDQDRLVHRAMHACPVRAISVQRDDGEADARR